MPTTDPTTGTPIPIDPSLTGDEIYDRIMTGIEPELTTEQLPTLSEKYKDETDEQKQARADRYNAAFDAMRTTSSSVLMQRSWKQRRVRASGRS